VVAATHLIFSHFLQSGVVSEPAAPPFSGWSVVPAYCTGSPPPPHLPCLYSLLLKASCFFFPNFLRDLQLLAARQPSVQEVCRALSTAVQTAAGVVSFTRTIEVGESPALAQDRARHSRAPVVVVSGNRDHPLACVVAVWDRG